MGRQVVNLTHEQMWYALPGKSAFVLQPHHPSGSFATPSRLRASVEHARRANGSSGALVRHESRQLLRQSRSEAELGTRRRMALRDELQARRDEIAPRSRRDATEIAPRRAARARHDEGPSLAPSGAETQLQPHPQPGGADGQLRASRSRVSLPQTSTAPPPPTAAATNGGGGHKMRMRTLSRAPLPPAQVMGSEGMLKRWSTYETLFVGEQRMCM